MMTRDATPFAASALHLFAGVLVWAAHFTVIYGYTGLACARRFHAAGPTWAAALPWVIGSATLVAAALAVHFMLPALRARERADFIDWMRAGLAALGLIGIVLEGLAILWVPSCG